MNNTLTVTLRPTRRIEVALRIGSRPPLTLLDDKRAVVVGKARVFVGPPGKPTLVRTRVYISTADAQPNMDMDDVVTINAQASPLHISNPISSGEIEHDRKLVIEIKDNGVAQDIVFGALYRGFAVPLPSNTVPGKRMKLGFTWSKFDAKWDLIAFASQL